MSGDAVAAGHPFARDNDQAHTSRQARGAVNSALARRYGRAFRARKGYSIYFLKLSPSSWRCTVRWRYGRFIYKGKVTVARRPDGRIASRTVVRKLVR